MQWSQRVLEDVVRWSVYALGEYWNTVETYWAAWGTGIVQFGIPAAVLLVVSTCLSSPVHSALERQYLRERYGVEMIASESRFAQWCLSLYNNHQLAYDVVVDSIRFAGHVLTFLFFYAIGGYAAVGILVILIPWAYCWIRRPTIKCRAAADAEEMISDGLLDEYFASE